MDYPYNDSLLSDNYNDADIDSALDDVNDTIEMQKQLLADDLQTSRSNSDAELDDDARLDSDTEAALIEQNLMYSAKSNDDDMDAINESDSLFVKTEEMKVDDDLDDRDDIVKEETGTGTVTEQEMGFRFDISDDSDVIKADSEQEHEDTKPLPNDSVEYIAEKILFDDDLDLAAMAQQQVPSDSVNGKASKDKKKEVKSKKEVEEEERERMQVLVSQFTEEQLDRYEMFRRAAFPKAAVKRLMQTITGCAVSQNVVIAMSGIAKVFVGEVVEEALDYMESQNETGPVQPKHLREAVRKLRQKNMIPSRGRKNPYFKL